MPDEWHTVEELTPMPDEMILAELRGCKVFDYAVLRVREDEDLGHIKRWRRIDTSEVENA